MFNFLRLFFIAFIALFLFSNYSYSKTPQKEEEKVWKLNIEAGATITKGNSREESIYSKNNLDYKKDEWTNLFKTRLENTKINNIRAKERYDLNNQTRYNYNEKNYRLLELEYIDDRYAGYDYRASETFGYGRNIIKEEKMNLSSQISTGLRQSKFTDGNSDLTWVVRAAIHYDWTIRDGIVFNENLDISIDKDAVITKSDASIKISLKDEEDSLYLKIGYFFENRSSAPNSSVKRTDTVFMTTIGYSF